MSKKKKRQIHKQKVANSHQEQLKKLKARLSGEEDDRAQLQGQVQAATRYVEERQEALTKLQEDSEAIVKAWRAAATKLKKYAGQVGEAAKLFEVEDMGDDSIQFVIDERDAAIEQARELQRQLDAQQAELSELRLYKLSKQEPCPPNWLVRMEREFDESARILTNDVKTTVAQKALGWAQDFRVSHALFGKDEQPDGEA